MEKIFKIDQMGRWFVAGGAAVGLGALCYYGLGMSNEIGQPSKQSPSKPLRMTVIDSGETLYSVTVSDSGEVVFWFGFVLK